MLAHTLYSARTELVLHWYCTGPALGKRWYGAGTATLVLCWCNTFSLLLLFGCYTETCLLLY